MARSKHVQKALLLLLCVFCDKTFSFSLRQRQGNIDQSSESLAISRRSAVGFGLTYLTSITTNPQPACAMATDDARSSLLKLIESNADDSHVTQAIEQLVPLDPSKGRAATMAQDLDGEWKLLWSIKAEAFSPLLQLPKPLKPDSYQYLGEAAKNEVGVDRVAQGLTGGILGNNQLWLSSGVFPSEEDPSVLDIRPPFRFQVGGRYGTGKNKTTIVEAGSDAEFRKANGRTSDAQKAPKNAYQQLYLEQGGKGALRISTITDGDPVIVGAVFIHQKI